MSLYETITEAVELGHEEGQLDADHHERLCQILLLTYRKASPVDIARAIGEVADNGHVPSAIKELIQELADDICSECEGGTPSQIQAAIDDIDERGEWLYQQRKDDRLTGDL